ncbi:MAG: response regulator [Desulfovibrio sp.]
MIGDDQKQLVLIVDDSPENVEVLRSALTEYHVSVALDGTSALDFMQYHTPDLVLLDVIMDGMDGYEVCRRMKEDSRFSDVPVIFITAKSNPEDEVRGLSLGAVDYIGKPFNLPVVLSKVNTHLELRAHRQRLAEEVHLRSVELDEVRRGKYQAEASLSASEKEKEVVLNSISESVTLLDHSHKVIWINRAGAEMAGKDVDALVGRKCYQIWGQNCICEGCPAQHALSIDAPYETWRVSESGRHLHVRTFPACSVHGECSGVVVVTSDVTEQRMAQRALKESAEKAEQASKAKSTFLASVSHELRTPLNGIIGLLQLLGDEQDADNEASSYVDIALSSGRGLLRVINDIIDLSRVEAGEMQLQGQAFSLAECVRVVGKLCEAICQDKGLEFVVSLGEGIPEMIVGDEGRVRQVLLNILGNAMKYTDEGSITLHVSVLPNAHKNYDTTVLFSVDDTGRGIPEESVDSIFDSFGRGGESTAEEEGVGLGLSIVRGLVHLMGGNAGVSSELGVGTSFYCSIPFKRYQEDTAVVPVTPQHRPSRVLHFLVAEDNMVNKLVVSRMLDKLDHTYTCVENGKEALEALRKETFDCVLMDVQMPVMGGIEAVQVIRAHEGNEWAVDIPVIALTAHAMRGDRDSFLASGMTDYLAKPLEFEALRSMIESLSN